jgi:hypothetical protein
MYSNLKNDDESSSYSAIDTNIRNSFIGFRAKKSSSIIGNLDNEINPKSISSRQRSSSFID